MNKGMKYRTLCKRNLCGRNLCKHGLHQFLITSALLMTTGVFSCYAVSPEFARSQEEWAKLRDNTLEYGEIEDLVREYNATVQNNEHDYNDRKEDPSADDVAQEYRDAAGEVRDLIIGDDETLLSDASLAAQANQLDQLADDNVMDLKVYRLTYDQTEKSLAMAAQNLMASYHQALINLETLEKNRVLLDEVRKVTETQYAVGMVSYLDVIAAREDLKILDVSIEELKTTIENIRQNLCVMLGWKYDAEPEILTLPVLDMTKIAKMDPAADVEKARENNYALKINQRKLENADGMYTKLTLESTIKDNLEKIGTALDRDYRAVLQAQTALEEANAKLSAEQDRLQAVTMQHQVGMASNLAYMQQETAVFAQEQAVNIAEINLFMAMETYEWDIRGMASVQ